MNIKTDLCPVPEKIRQYYSMELDENELNEMEEHFAHCTECLRNYAYYEEFIEQIALSASVQKELWEHSNADCFTVAVAEGYNDTVTSEISSINGKYNLKLIPYLDERHKALLVIELTDINKKGSIKVDLIDNNDQVFIGIQEINDENQVCFEVNTDITLRNIIITII